MPYRKRKIRGKPLYRVFNTETGKVYSKGSTKKDAEDQIRFLYSLENNKGKGKINPKYVPDVLSEKDKKKQIKSIQQGKDRPKVDYRKRRSSWTVLADKYFGDAKSIEEMAEVLGVDKKGLEEIIEKGRGAYYSSGSRPNQTAESWGRARLYAVLFGSKKAREVDKDIVEKYNIPLVKLGGSNKFSRWFKKKYESVRYLLGKSHRYTNTASNTLKKYGDCVIKKAVITRTPLSTKLNKALQVVSLGSWVKKTRKEGLDKLFHLSLLLNVECPNGNITTLVVEKNEVINISDNPNVGITKDTEFMDIRNVAKRNIDLETLMAKTREYMTDRSYFTYDPFTNNCQVFIDSILTANDLNTEAYHEFLFQSLDGLYNSLPKYLPKTMKFFTKTGAFVARLTGRGKVGDMVDKTLERKNDDDYSDKVKEVIDKISFPDGNVEILGSMGFRSQRYTTDYDCFQVVQASSIQQIKDEFQSIVRNIQKDPNIMISDIKLGNFEATRIVREDARIGKMGKLINYDPKKSKKKAVKLAQMGLITPEELDTAERMLIDKPNVEELKNIIKKLRFNIIRWKPREVLEGKKDFRGVEYTLEEGFKSKSLFKLDAIAFIFGRYVEFSIIYDLRLNGTRLNYIGIDALKTLMSDMKLYSFTGNWFKYLKRLFSYYNYILKYKKNTAKQRETIGKEVLKIIDILNSDIGILYTIVQDLDVIMLMVEDLNKPPNDRMEAIIDHTIDRMSNVFSSNEFLREDAKLIELLDKTRETKEKDKFVGLLKNIIDRMSEIISNHTNNLMKREKVRVLK